MVFRRGLKLHLGTKTFANLSLCLSGKTFIPSPLMGEGEKALKLL